MHRSGVNSRDSQQNQVQAYNISHDQQIQHQQQYSQQRISRTEHTVSRQVTQQRGPLSVEDVDGKLIVPFWIIVGE